MHQFHPSGLPPAMGFLRIEPISIPYGALLRIALIDFESPICIRKYEIS
jgi:hypothetical protein